MKKVAIFTTPSCVYCKKTKEFFKNHSVEYMEYDVTRDVARRDEMIQRSGQMGVPVIDIDGTLVLGFDERRLRQLLGVGA
ncbi:MAG: NrdH-redoxin [Candidatus Ryanbacteria bacterium RIFCSPHIGHO2_12_FULL_47_12b]|uniref:NrdH-redoxin n=1 Tax=Candidatus Ryanbacteria bacterium RIFCSPLOWO2_02_FULL_47_14 TaxID=1802129 RepID=A0A1G2H2N7_9BACT|nr:MAG: NrdH-redoxin [Candidatus Ryanbacteria bacterium RIFCSPHIGHO2_12_FULL_47_12b]OGZ56501.1 MAG: NrdH-redoxin [Candidatus Ryanbacteria bacterium RIFCSPLOWO2_02_FULL_47_14]